MFFYQDKPYPPTDGRFRKKVTWSGDIAGGDASILLHEVKFTFNGTYSCQVKNPPDVHGIAGEVELRVVASGQSPGHRLALKKLEGITHRHMASDTSCFRQTSHSCKKIFPGTGVEEWCLVCDLGGELN